MSSEQARGSVGRFKLEVRIDPATLPLPLDEAEAVSLELSLFVGGPGYEGSSRVDLERDEDKWKAR